MLMIHAFFICMICSGLVESFRFSLKASSLYCRTAKRLAAGRGAVAVWRLRSTSDSRGLYPFLAWFRVLVSSPRSNKGAHKYGVRNGTKNIDM